MRNTKRTKTALFLIIILFAFAGYVYSQNSSKKKNEKIENASEYGNVVNGAATIVLTHEELENSGIITVKLKETKHRSDAITYGSVVSIQDLSKDVQSYETANAQLAKNEEDLSVSQKNYERLKSLYEKKLTSEQDYQTAQATYLSDKASVSSAQANLIGIKSEINEQWGNAISKIILNDSIELQNLLSLKEILIQISLPPSESNLTTGQAGIKIPNKIFILSPQNNKGRIVCTFISAGHLADLQFQTKTLYYVTTNTTLSSGINVKALLPEGNDLKGVIVPASSIVWYQGKAWAYVQASTNNFNRIEIDTNNPAGSDFFVAKKSMAISPGNYVVTKGAQLLLSKELVPAQKTSTGE